MADRQKSIAVTLCFLFIFYSAFAQENTRELRILFYNLENLFDIQDDSLTADENFTPDGEMHWTYNRLVKKANNISKAIIAAGGWQSPEILFFCEVENRYVLEKLTGDTPLKNSVYKIIHKESPDHRGIDIAMLYKNDWFEPIQYQYYPLVIKGKILNTREILHVSGIVAGTDTVHIFANHWPSRYSGFLETQELREDAARLLKALIDNVKKKHRNPKIVITGDFNENPDSEIFKSELGVEPFVQNYSESAIYNLSNSWLKPGKGTLKFQSQWFVFDQFMITGSMLNKGNSVFVKPESASIIDFPFLLEEDKKYGGQKPFRTYNGFDYQGGFSDHLPVILRITIN